RNGDGGERRAEVVGKGGAECARARSPLAGPAPRTPAAARRAAGGGGGVGGGGPARGGRQRHGGRRRGAGAAPAGTRAGPRRGPGPGAPADYVTWYLPRRFSTTEDGNVASAYASSSYSMPGMWVTERTVQVPLDWAAPDGERIDLFIRELVDPDRRSEDLPLLT